MRLIYQFSVSSFEYLLPGRLELLMDSLVVVLAKTVELLLAQVSPLTIATTSSTRLYSISRVGCMKLFAAIATPKQHLRGLPPTKTWTVPQNF